MQRRTHVPPLCAATAACASAQDPATAEHILDAILAGSATVLGQPGNRKGWAKVLRTVCA